MAGSRFRVGEKSSGKMNVAFVRAVLLRDLCIREIFGGVGDGDGFSGVLCQRFLLLRGR